MTHDTERLVREGLAACPEPAPLDPGGVRQGAAHLRRRRRAGSIVATGAAVAALAVGAVTLPGRFVEENRGTPAAAPTASTSLSTEENPLLGWLVSWSLVSVRPAGTTTDIDVSAANASMEVGPQHGLFDGVNNCSTRDVVTDTTLTLTRDACTATGYAGPADSPVPRAQAAMALLTSPGAAAYHVLGRDLVVEKNGTRLTFVARAMSGPPRTAGSSSRTPGSTATTPGGTTTSPGGSATSPSSTAAVSTSVGASSLPPFDPATAGPREVIARYLAASQVGDCAEANRVVAPGETARLCELHLTAARLQSQPGAGSTGATVDPTEVVFSTRLEGDLTPLFVDSGHMTWFVTVRVVADGTWKVARQGTGP